MISAVRASLLVCSCWSFGSVLDLPTIDGAPVLLEDDSDSEGAGEKKKSKKKAEIPPPPFDNLNIPASALGKHGSKLEKALAERSEFMAKRKEKSLKAALSAFKSIPKDSVGYAMANYYAAELHLYDEEYKKSKEHLEAALKANPNFFEAQAMLGETLRRDGDTRAAIDCFNKSLAIYPHYRDAWEGLSFAQLDLGMFSDARDSMKKMLEIEPDEDYEEWIEFIERHIRGPDWGQVYTCETEHYIVKTPISQEFADQIGRCQQQARGLYKQFFPEQKRPDRKYEIRVFRSKEEYHANGAPQQAAGHYNPATRTLHLYEMETRADTLLTLYHEGFHQYLHESMDKIPQWFNEGLADFFGGAIITPDGKMAELNANPWRVDYLKQAIQMSVCPTAEELMNMSRETMYGKNVGVHYAQAWAIVYYCLNGGNSGHRQTLGNYFKYLRKGFDQAEAYENTFGKIDMKLFERNWRNCIDRLPSSDEIDARRNKAARLNK